MLRRSSILLLLSLVLLTMAAPARAHSDLVSTDPADKTVATTPVERIELVFSGEVEPTGDGIRIIDASRLPVAAFVFQPTASTVVAEPEDPLPDGAYAVVWEVQSDDSHQLSGSFSFAVDASGAPQTGPGKDSPASDAETEDRTAATTVTTTDTTTLATTLTPTTTAPTSDSAASAGGAQAQLQEPFAPIVVDEPNTTMGDWLARIGRWAAMTGALLAIGAFAFAATSLIGAKHEVWRAVGWVRRGAVLVLVGTLLEVVGVSVAWAGSVLGAMSLSSLIDVLGGQFGVAVLLRISGGMAMLQDPRLVTVSPGHPVADANRLPGAFGASQSSSSRAMTAVAPPEANYRLEVQHEWLTLAGMSAVAVSFLFDGHTVTADPGVIARSSTLVHIVFAGVWFGGVVVMANTLTRRWRASLPLDAAAMAVRFSRVAAASLVLVALAGLALTWVIIDEPSDLVSGSWGRLLLVKVGLVGVAAALGAYNHFKVVPHLNIGPDQGEAASLLQRTTRIEGIVLVIVITVTALLVGASI